MKKITLFTTIILAAFTAAAQIIHVPADETTIQQGIDASSDGDTVLVAEGTYQENINFNGMAITVASNFIMGGDTSHISNTIIDGSQPENPDIGSVVTFDSGEDTTSVLYGFTITGGSGTSILEGPTDAKAGGGIIFGRSGGKVLYNYIEYNEVIYDKLTMGGGLTAGGPINPQPWLVLRGNKIRYNKSISTSLQANGGGLEVYCNLIMADNEITHNEADGALISLGGGSSIFGMFGHIEVEITNNTIKYNKSISNSEITSNSEGGGLVVSRDVTGIISNNDISFNEVHVYSEKYGYGAGAVIYRTSQELLFENNLLTNNNFTGDNCVGGGLCIWSGGGIYQNNVIQNNTGTLGGGIGVGYNNSDSLAVLINNTITGNEGVYGGGLYLLEADAVVINTILWDNEALEEGDEIYEEESKLEVRYSNVEGEEEWPGNGNVNIDPEFRNDGYHLDWPSMLVNQGINSIQIGNEWYDAPEYDIDGDERPFEDTYPDIGADEAQWPYTSVDESISTKSSLIGVFPNPFSSSSIIEFELQTASNIIITIYNHLGELVEVILEESQPQGTHQLTWSSENLPSGVYFCILKTESGTQTAKMIKLK